MTFSKISPFVSLILVTVFDLLFVVGPQPVANRSQRVASGLVRPFEMPGTLVTRTIAVRPCKITRNHKATQKERTRIKFVVVEIYH